MAGNCGLIGTGIPALVTNTMGFAEGVASTQIAATNASLGRMADALAGLVITPMPSAPAVGEIPVISAPPVQPKFITMPKPEFPDAPASPPAIAGVYPNFPTAPSNTAHRPTITLPTAPAPFSGVAPVSPGIGTVAIPDAPVLDTSIPVPALLDLVVPDAPAIIYAEFDAVLNPHGLTPPDAIFEYTENPYDSALLQAVILKLKNDIQNGTTGLSPAAEYAIWARGAEREASAIRQAKADAMNEGAARGFSYPTGATAQRLMDIEQSALSKGIELSREVMVEQARLAQNNMQFAITSGIDLEGKIMSYMGDYARRAFEAASLAFNAQFTAFAAAVSLYNADVSAYQIQSVVYKTRIEAEGLKLEAFRSEIEAQKLIGEINKDSIAIYTAQFQALQIQADLYKSLMQGAAIAMDMEKTKIDAYKSEVDAFQSLVMANKSQFDAYASQINAEMSKVDMYRVDISAYQAAIQAYATETTAESSRINAETSIQELNQKSFGILVDSYRARVMAESERMKAYATNITATAEVYRSEIAGYSAETQALVSRYQAEMSQRIAAFEQGVRGVQIELDASLRATQMAVAAIDGAAKNSAAISASAINAMNVSAGISDSVSNGTSCSTTYSY